MTREERQQLSEAFDRAAPWISAALERGIGGMDVEDVKERVMLEDFQLWLGEDFAAVTEVLDYPQRRTVLVLLAGGNMESLIQADSELVKFARAIDASGIEIIGRKGWVRALRNNGYRETSVHLFKEV